MPKPNNALFRDSIDQLENIVRELERDGDGENRIENDGRPSPEPQDAVHDAQTKNETASKQSGE